jgi:hypothetical protein
MGFGPSKPSLRANSASGRFGCGFHSLEIFQASGDFELFKSRLQPLESLSSGWQSLYTVRVWMPEPSKHIFQSPVLFEYGLMLGRTSLSGYQSSSLNVPESWWQYTSSDAVCQIRR